VTSDNDRARSRFLLLDSRVVDTAENADLVVGVVEKDRHNPLFAEDKPWEPRFDNGYPNVIFDEEEDRYKCWYSPFVVDERTAGTPPGKRNPESLTYLDVTPDRREMGVCYAVSNDGIRWEKPELGLVEFDGSGKNNIVMRGQGMEGMPRGPHGAGVFKDVYESDPAKRYKMFFRAETMAVAFSDDGLRWSAPIPCPEIRAEGDTRNNAFWAPELGTYVGITRTNAGEGESGARLVARTESPDFVNWTPARTVLRGLTDRLQTHDLVAFPHGGVYLGLVGLYDTDKDADRQHVELAWSPDTIEWRRICPGTPLIPNSAQKGEYDWGCVFASQPVVLENEIRLYYGGNNGGFMDWRNGFLCLARLRPDGFAGYAPRDREGPAVITTTSIVHRKGPLRVSADVEQNGYVKVRLLDPCDKSIAESKPLRRTVTDAAVAWECGRSFSDFREHTVRLGFEFSKATVYSFSFDT